jgi:allantoinase
VTAGPTIFTGQVLTADGIVPRAVHVRDGVITAVTPWRPGDQPDHDSEMITLGPDEVLIAGLIDTHVHVNEPGRTEWEGFATATRAAGAGGVTTILDMPLNSIPATTDPDALEIKRQAAAGRCSVDVGFWGGAVPANLGRLAELQAAGVLGFKCFLLDAGVAEFPPLSGEQLRRAMAEIAAFDGLLAVHAEDPDIIAGSAMPHTRRYREYLASRPPTAETTAISTVLDAARETGCRVHIVHLSAAEALPALLEAKSQGVRVSVETCPHYLTLAAEEVADGHTEFKCCPPVREAANAELLWQGLADGVIDVVVSDHSPTTPDLKLLDDGDFPAAWGGISSLQLGLSLVWTSARRRGFGLSRVIDWMATRTAALAGLGDRGAIAPGLVAHLAIFAPEAGYRVDGAALRHRHPLTPYEGRTLHGVARASYLRGVRVEDNDPRGALLSRAAETRILRDT